MADVKLKRGLQNSYDTIEERDSDTIYVCTDSGNVYLGDKRLDGDWRNLLNKPDLLDVEVDNVPGYTSYRLRFMHRQY